MTTRPNIESLLLFEQPLAKVPYEQLRRGFRNTQRNVEFSFNQLTAAVEDISVSASAERDTEHQREKILTSMDNMIARVETLRRKLDDVNRNIMEPMQRDMRKRADHLIAFESPVSMSIPAHLSWTDVRLNRWLVDWMLRVGFDESAEELAKAKNIQSLVDISLFADIRRITRALTGHSCAEALAWCSENKAALRKAKSTLEFELRMQEFIELVRVMRYTQAISYSKKYLTVWHDTHPTQFRQVMTLLAWGPTAPKHVLYRRLYDNERWQTLSQMFTDTAFSLASLPSSPLLSLALYAGLAALKHPACFATSDSSRNVAEGRNVSGKNSDCPICDDAGLGILAREVPSSQHLNSTLVCAISGRIMDDNNPPRAFNNGHVYSKQALEKMSKSTGGIVTCPRSDQVMKYSELRKVFVT